MVSKSVILIFTLLLIVTWVCYKVIQSFKKD